jgi:hypothetical protein
MGFQDQAVWIKWYVEFEYKSSHFNTHKHDSGRNRHLPMSGLKLSLERERTGG